MEIKKYIFEPHGDDRGKLVALEELADVPFSIKRVYYMYDTTQGVARGKHAHKSLEQILVCVHGSCKVLLDDGIEKAVVNLSAPNEGLQISPDCWHEMYDFTPDAVLMVLASDLYDEDDYIRDYKKFIEYEKQKMNNG